MIQPFTKENLLKWIKGSYSLRDVLIKSGRNPAGGGSYGTLKRKFEEYDINIPKFPPKPVERRHGSCGSKRKWAVEEILISNSPVTQKVLREYIRLYNVIEYKCAFCGNKGEWQGKTLVLQLDHINGDNRDNRIENLRYLCPNCHSTTDTFCGKNKGD